MLHGVDISGSLTPELRYALAERDKMIERDGWTCWRCHEPLSSHRGQRAHRIARTKPNLAKYGPYILDHAENIQHSCTQCNPYAMRFHPGAREAMLELIRVDLAARGLPSTPEEWAAVLDKRHAATQTAAAKEAARKREHKSELQRQRKVKRLKEKQDARAAAQALHAGKTCAEILATKAPRPVRADRKPDPDKARKQEEARKARALQKSYQAKRGKEYADKTNQLRLLKRRLDNAMQSLSCVSARALHEYGDGWRTVKKPMVRRVQRLEARVDMMRAELSVLIEWQKKH